jgi:hypothetical protein
MAHAHDFSLALFQGESFKGRDKGHIRFIP